ncbi:MAG TPA: GNAT family N-acetyltransferase, partial [Fimbriimonadaceae bacterium]|nr:GNAT family N-acetyltransferase [Fimbriimonadaceae bacterium]
MEQSLSATSELIAPGGFKIRTLELRDYDSVAEIMNSYEDEGMTGDIMRKNHARWDQNDPRRVLVAEQDGRICGFLNTRRRQTDPQGQFIVLLFVHKDCCGQGLGRALLEQAQD